MVQTVAERRAKKARAERERRRERREAGLCGLCGENPSPDAYACETCRADHRAAVVHRRERQPLVHRFEVALDLARKGRNVRDCLHHAGILGPLLRGEE